MVLQELASPVEVLKKCPSCKEEKPLSDYYAAPKSTSKWKVSTECKVCTRKRTKAYQEKNSEKVKASRQARRSTDAGRRKERERSFQRWYGISVEQVEAMITLQGGVCAICPRPISLGKYTHVDHNHSTGKVRGVLCIGCNHLLGKASDDVSILRSAIDYLEKHNV